MIRRPPRSTLFSYAPLFRSQPARGRPAARADGRRLPLRARRRRPRPAPLADRLARGTAVDRGAPRAGRRGYAAALRDRKSTRLNSSHANLSYAVLFLKKILE